MIQKILVANRGEIAVNIIRACRHMGIQSVAVYSKEDAQSLHVQLADQCLCIGQGSFENSYLQMEHLISAALYTGADAIHPGCGFLAENVEFARLCQKHNLIFIGPNPKLIEQMHNSAQIEQIMASVGIALSSNDSTSIKPSGTATKVAKAPRMIEIQLVADHFGHIVALGERDCSLQGKQSKLIEETPSPALDAGRRQALMQAAIRIAKAIHYINVGTITFALDEFNHFYFVGMTTSIQIGHGLTEMATGLDLISEQIRIADGQPLSFKQEDVIFRGHALSCRIIAGTPYQNSKTSSGLVRHLHLPAGNGIRVDTILYTGYRLPTNDDAEIAQIIVRASDRSAAIQKMQAALDEMVVLGVETNLDFQYSIMEDPKFKEGCINRDWIE